MRVKKESFVLSYFLVVLLLGLVAHPIEKKDLRKELYSRKRIIQVLKYTEIEEIFNFCINSERGT